MEKKKILFVINQFFKGGAETALLNLFGALPPERYEIDFLVLDQVKIPGTISLLPEVPPWIRVVDVAEREGVSAFLKKAWFRLYRRFAHRQLFRRAALDYLRERRYDIAFSFGEWFSSRLVAEYAQAKRKYVWIHADMDKAAFLHPDILCCQQHFDRFLFTSARSMEAAAERYPILRGRGLVVHNLIDERKLRSLEGEPLPEWFPADGLPVLVTVANLREEKNHLRQVQVMRRLFREGKRFYWLNVGTLANRGVVGRVQAAVREAGLEDYFLLPGAVENPFPLMKRADAVCVLSDHESWSMVITEAKALGTPVIATETSGALEQLEDGVNGLLCDFSEEDIAGKIGRFLEQPALRARLRKNLEGFSPCADTLEQLEGLLGDERKRIVYLFDDVNYLSGARSAALAQMACLRTAAQVELFSLEPCRDEALAAQYRVLDLDSRREMPSLFMSCGEALRTKDFSLRQKCFRVLYALLARVGGEQALLRLLLRHFLPPLLNCCDAVCVVSEASKLRGAVSHLTGPKRIQWIHTDYAAWRERSGWTRRITRWDRWLYRRFDVVVCLSARIRERFVQIYPQLEEKTAVIPNFIQYSRIQSLAGEPPDIVVEPGRMNLITVGRMDSEKRYDLILRTAQKLIGRGAAFHWYLVGGGVLLDGLRTASERLGLTEHVTFTGELKNPYPLMRQCDALILLSDYEGTPVTIDEAKVLGLPVLARDVGGIRDQLEAGKYGEILPDTASVCGRILERVPLLAAPGMDSARAEEETRSISAKLAEVFGVNL